MLESGATEAIVDVRSGFGGEDVALLHIEAHSPPGCLFLEALEVVLQGEVIVHFISRVPVLNNGGHYTMEMLV